MQKGVVIAYLVYLLVALVATLLITSGSLRSREAIEAIILGEGAWLVTMLEYLRLRRRHK